MLRQEPKILIGADPELFIFDGNTGLPVSAHDIVPGTKQNPFKVNSGGSLQVDGVAAEFNIQPAATVEQFADNIFLTKGALWRIIREKNKSYQLKAEPTVFFTRKIWQSIPDSAKALGCEPDYNAYTCEENVKPETKQFMRTGAGHIHISWGDDILENGCITRKRFNDCVDLTKHLDAHLYPASLAWDDDEKRRELYGKVGCFRPKPYGLEYRVLSNKWLNTKKSVDFVFYCAVACTKAFIEGRKPGEYEIVKYVG